MKEEKKPNGVYCVEVTVSPKLATVLVVAASEKEAESKALQNIDCIDTGEFYDDGAEACCQYECDIDILNDEEIIYDEEFTRMSVSDYRLQQQEELAMLEEGGEEL